MMDAIFIVAFICWFVYSEPEALSYEIFMWGDIGIVTDVRFYGVAPHWYFRPFMAWLIACPYHKTGIFGLIFFFFVLFFQPALHGISEQNSYSKKTLLFLKNKFSRLNIYTANYLNSEINTFHQFTYGLFIGCCLYVASFLPYGRFYSKLGGNIGLVYAYMYVFCYLGFSIFRRPIILDLFFFILYSKIIFLKNLSNAKRLLSH
jgi:hypothetical protein